MCDIMNCDIPRIEFRPVGIGTTAKFQKFDSIDLVFAALWTFFDIYRWSIRLRSERSKDFNACLMTKQYLLLGALVLLGIHL